MLGTPDIVFTEDKLIVFVHGCYWHRHDDCQLAKIPKKNFVTWLSRFNTAVIRDNQIYSWHETRNWEIFIAWECEIQSNVYAIADRIFLRLNELRKCG